MYMQYKWMNWLIGCMLFLLASCDKGAEVMEDTQPTRTIVFTLSLGDTYAHSRAAWNEEYTSQTGNELENRIDMKGLQVSVFAVDEEGNAGTTPIGKAQNLFYWKTTETEGDDPVEYQLVADISHIALQENATYRFMVFANFPHTTDNNFLYSEVNGQDAYIPMWGVTTVPDYKDKERIELGTIDLLRAAAKVEVEFDESVVGAESSPFTLKGLGIHNYNRTGYCLPNGWHSAETTGELDQEECIRVTSDHVHGSLSFLEYKTAEKYVIYLPEYSNVSHDDEGKSVVEVVLKNKATGNEKRYEIPFCSYQEGRPVEGTDYNIVRNHIYNFRVNGVAPGGLMLNLKVANWEDGSVLELGNLAYPTYINPVLPSIDHQYPNVDIEKQPKMKYTVDENAKEENAFVAWFNFINANTTISTDYVWKPTIVNNTASNYRIKVYDGDNNELLYDSDNSEEEDLKTNYKGWFKIVVIPTKQVPDNKKFIFGISCSVHPSGFSSEDFYLFINGEIDKIAWPNSGTDRKFIEITQE